jgi:hypothetical protein
VIDAAVVRDAIQPGLDVDVAVVVAQGAVRADEDVLQHVFGVLARACREHLADVGEQPLAVAVVQHAERVVVAAAQEPDQLLVGAQAQQRTRDREATDRSCGDLEG